MKRTIIAFAIVAAVSLVSAGAFGAPKFFLPERICAAPGLESNIYFSDVFDSVVPQNYAFQVYAKKGKSWCNRWAWTPEESDAGTNVQLVVNAWNDDGLVASATTTVVVAEAPKDPKKRLTLALFADSLTNSRYQDRMLAQMRKAGFEGYTPVGSRKGLHEGAAAHDGFGGYTCGAFLSYYTVSEEEFNHVQDDAEREQLKALGVPVKVIHDWQRGLLRSPLVQFRDGKKVVDVPAYLEKVNGGEPPDVVVIQLGVNAVFSFRGEEAELHERIRREVIPSYSKFIETLRPYMPKARLAVCTQPIGAGQDGFAYNYGAGWNEVQHRKIMFALNREIEAWVRGLNDPRVELVALGQALDPFHSFVHTEMPVNAVSDAKADLAVNAVHPNAEGGYQMGDTLAAWLRCRWNEFAITNDIGRGD